MGALRSDLYTALAEALADPPDWLALPGREWPVYTISTRLDLCSPEIRQAIEKMEHIPAEPLTLRRERYDALFCGPGRPRFWLYESLYRSGKLFGPETAEVEAIYRAAGLSSDGAELPDHASLELAFLAYAAQQQSISGEETPPWQEIERKFIQQHAGRWLPALGRDLAGSQDEVYAPVGQLLAGWLTNNARSFLHRQCRSSYRWAPALPKAEDCNLCGFCVQVCPRQTLAIRENAMESVLVSTTSACSGCGKCERTCPTHALRIEKLQAGTEAPDDTVVLRSSPRAQCPKCGQPTVSQAEIEAIVEKIGNFPWIELCPDCRLVLMEDAQ